MELFTFKKGIHPKDNKALGEDLKIEVMPAPAELVFPMAQHLCAPCEPVVTKGDRVLVGQRLGEAKGFGLSAVHSSVSGTVKTIEKRMSTASVKTASVIVENDGLYESVSPPLNRDYNGLSKQEIIDIIRECGIVGMGGAAFPTHVKLSPPPDCSIDHVILNGAECEPYLNCDYRLMLEEPEAVIKGLDILLRLFDGATGVIGIESNKPKAVESMKKAAEGYANIEVKVLRTKYPQGAEKNLIDALTNRRVPGGKLPAHIGCVVQNVATASQIYKSVVQGVPLIERIVSVTGDAVANPKNLRVKLGTTVADLIAYCGGFREDPVKVISGGPMMGVTLQTTDVPVVKGTSGILCLGKSEAVLPESGDCIRCARCVDTCPMDLMPYLLNSLSQRNKLEDFDKTNGTDCVECGCCSYICPAKIQLLQSIRSAKGRVLAARKK